jgi:hypothetical protein
MNWQIKIFEETQGEGLTISGPSAEAIADALILMLECHQSSTAYQSPPGVISQNMPLRNFIQRWHTIQMYDCIFFFKSMLRTFF